MVSRILQRNYVRKWLIRYYKPLENSGYIRCYKGWVFWATINRSIKDISPLVTEHDESKSFLPATTNQLTDEFRENFVNVPLHYNLFFFTKHMLHIFLQSLHQSFVILFLKLIWYCSCFTFLICSYFFINFSKILQLRQITSYEYLENEELFDEIESVFHSI